MTTPDTAEATAAPPESADLDVARPGRDARVHRWLLAAIVVVQAVVFTLAAAPGSFSTDDLDFLFDARPDVPGWSYLTLPVNDHLSPGLRLSFWLIRHLTGLDHGATVAARVVLLAAITLLFHHVLTQLIGARPFTLGLTALFALNPVLVTTSLWLTTAVNQLPAAALVLVALVFHIRYVRSGRLVHAAGAGLSLFLAACFWESAAIGGVMFFWLSVGFLNPGGARARLRRTAEQWRGWLLEVAGPVTFVLAFVVGGYGQRATAPSVSGVLEGTWQQWLFTTAPSLVGGPWRWYSAPDVYVASTAPALPWAIGVQLVLLVVVTVGWRRIGSRVLCAVAMPLTVGLIGFTALAFGRLSVYGLLISRLTRYGVVTLVPAVLLVALALGWRAGQPRSTAPARTTARPRRRALAAVAGTVALVASCTTSVSRAAIAWHRNPTGAYLDELDRSLREAGPRTQLYDVPITPRVLPILYQRRELSRLTDLMGFDPDFVPVGEDGLVVDDSGRLRPASFYRYATAPGDGNAFCGNLVRGVTPRTMTLDRTLDAGTYVVRIAWFQQHPTPVTVEVRDAAGRTATPLSGDRVTLPGTGGVVYLSFPPTAVRTVTVRSDAADANVCLTDVGVGFPFVRSGP